MITIQTERIDDKATFCLVSGVWPTLWAAYNDPAVQERFERWKLEREAAPAKGVK